MVAQLAVANSIFTDVVTEGTAAIATTAARNANREAALTGFDNACSCERVAPLETVTVTDLVGGQVRRILPLITTGLCHPVKDCGKK